LLDIDMTYAIWSISEKIYAAANRAILLESIMACYRQKHTYTNCILLILYTVLVMTE